MSSNKQHWQCLKPRLVDDFYGDYTLNQCIGDHNPSGESPPTLFRCFLLIILDLNRGKQSCFPRSGSSFQHCWTLASGFGHRCILFTLKDWKGTQFGPGNWKWLWCMCFLSQSFFDSLIKTFSQVQWCEVWFLKTLCTFTFLYQYNLPCYLFGPVGQITVLSPEVTQMMMRGFRLNTLTYNAFANSFLVPCHFTRGLLKWVFLKMGDPRLASKTIGFPSQFL